MRALFSTAEAMCLCLCLIKRLRKGLAPLLAHERCSLTR